MRHRTFTSETDLAKHIIAYLEDLQWDVYQEVQPRALGPVVDIVAIQGRLVWVIECKLSFGLSVIEQAYNWRGKAHFISVAVPYSRNDRMARLTVKEFGLGHLSVIDYDYYVKVEESIAPRLDRKARAGAFVKVLTPEHKTYAQAGNANGSHWTPFQQTCQNVKRLVEQRPGICMKDMVEGVKTHYKTTSTARTCLKHWIEVGKVSGVRMERDGKQLKLYPVEHMK